MDIALGRKSMVWQRAEDGWYWLVAETANERYCERKTWLMADAGLLVAALADGPALCWVTSLQSEPLPSRVSRGATWQSFGLPTGVTLLDVVCVSLPPTDCTPNPPTCPPRRVGLGLNGLQLWRHVIIYYTGYTGI